MEEIKKLLADILVEMKFQSKLLSSMVEGMDAKEHDAKVMKKNIVAQMEATANTLPGPFGDLLRKSAREFGGKSDGE